MPSTLREEKVATFCLAVVVTLRLPEAGGGEGWIRRGRAGGGGLEGAAATEVVEEAKVAWCRAALTLAFSFFAGRDDDGAGLQKLKSLAKMAQVSTERRSAPA